jgi:hypothetical protein
MRRSILILVVLCFLTPASLSAQLLPTPILASASLEGDPQVLVDWMRAIYARVRYERLSAPAGSRVYAYAGIAAYESLAPFMANNRSLSFQINGLEDLPLPEEWGDVTPSDLLELYDVQTVANAVMTTVAINLFRDQSDDSRAAFIALRQQWEDQRAADGIDAETLERSLEYGELLGKSFNDYVNEDNYREVRQRDPYEMPHDSPDDYVLTGEASQPAEPYWGDIRTFIMPYTELCWQPPTVEYSEDESSAFYQQAMEVFEVGNDLTAEQRAIATWWVDTPAITGTPAGHWVEIENQLVDLLDLDIGRAAEMYAMVGMVLGDAFIATWDHKYALNLLRPETYINLHISERWRPFIVTPPFPEYPSGHSVVSGAAADMLTALFGPVQFIDETHVEQGELPREFHSFEEAGGEAAISRLYGGIHYRNAIENGVRSGRCITDVALNNVVMRPVQQGE